MEGYCSTDQSPQWAVVLMEEEKEYVCVCVRARARAPTNPGRDSSVGIATRYGLDGPGSNPGGG